MWWDVCGERSTVLVMSQVWEPADPRLNKISVRTILGLFPVIEHTLDALGPLLKFLMCVA